MVQVKKLVKDVSELLLDQRKGHEYSRWTISELLSYLRDAVASLYSYRPDAFSTTQELTLQAGRMQRLPEGAVSLTSIDSNVDGSEAPVLNANLKLLRAFAPKNCNGSVYTTDCVGEPKYRVRTYAYDPKNPGVYYVSPAVPESGTYKVMATVNSDPAVIDETTWNDELDLPLKYIPVLVEYMLYRAYSKETESVTSVALSRTHLANFYNALGVNYKQETRMHSGYYLGQRGSGDPNAGSR